MRQQRAHPGRAPVQPSRLPAHPRICLVWRVVEKQKAKHCLAALGLVALAGVMLLGWVGKVWQKAGQTLVASSPFVPFGLQVPRQAGLSQPCRSKMRSGHSRRWLEKGGSRKGFPQEQRRPTPRGGEAGSGGGPCTKRALEQELCPLVCLHPCRTFVLWWFGVYQGVPFLTWPYLLPTLTWPCWFSVLWLGSAAWHKEICWQPLSARGCKWHHLRKVKAGPSCGPL